MKEQGLLESLSSLQVTSGRSARNAGLHVQSRSVVRQVRVPPWMQTECGVTLNCVESLEGFVSDINAGRWDAVLPVVANLKLPRSLLEQLYEHVGCTLFWQTNPDV